MNRFLLNSKVNILDDKKGIVQYIASDQSVDSDREIIKASGWRFDLIKRGMPFADSHNYSSIEYKLGEVTDWDIKGDQLLETIQYLMDVPEHRLATIAWKMTLAGMPPAVSVGFQPVKTVNRSGSPADWRSACALVNQDPQKTPAIRIFLEQQQRELSAVIIGANPNAVAKSYKAGALDDADLETLSTMQAKRETASMTASPADVIKARQRERTAFLMELYTKQIKTI